MNSWNQPQQQNNMVMGQAQFNPYSTWSNIQPRTFNAPLPVYHAEPIHGENAAWQFPMGPNSEIWLPDADRDLVWWIRTDQNGNKNVLSFDVKPHQEPKATDMDEILARLGALEEWVNGKQNKSNAKRNVANNAATVNAGPATESVN